MNNFPPDDLHHHISSNSHPDPASIGAFMALMAQKVEQANKDNERTLRQYETVLTIVNEMDNRIDINEADLKVAIRDIHLILQSIEKQGKRIGLNEQQRAVLERELLDIEKQLSSKIKESDDSCQEQFQKNKQRLDQWEAVIKTVATLGTIIITLAGLFFAFRQAFPDDKSHKDQSGQPKSSQLFWHSRSNTPESLHTFVLID